MHAAVTVMYKNFGLAGNAEDLQPTNVLPAKELVTTGGFALFKAVGEVLHDQEFGTSEKVLRVDMTTLSAPKSFGCVLSSIQITDPWNFNLNFFLKKSTNKTSLHLYMLVPHLSISFVGTLPLSMAIFYFHNVVD